MTIVMVVIFFMVVVMVLICSNDMMVDEGADSGDLRSWTPQHNRIHRFVSRRGIPPTCIKLIFASRNSMTYDVILGYHGVTLGTKLLDKTRSGIFAVWGLANTGWNSWERRTCNVGKAMITPIFWWPVYGKIGDGGVTIALRTSYLCVETYLPLRSGYSTTSPFVTFPQGPLRCP